MSLIIKNSYYLKYVYSPTKDVYSYVEKSEVTNNYQYYESQIDKRIWLDFSKGKSCNENVVNN
jgi:hypothetical protein